MAACMGSWVWWVGEWGVSGGVTVSTVVDTGAWHVLTFSSVIFTARMDNGDCSSDDWFVGSSGKETLFLMFRMTH